MNMVKAMSSITFCPVSQMRRVILLSQLDVKHVATVKQPVTLAEDILGNMLTVASYSLHRHDGGSDLRSNSWQVCKNVLLPRVRFGFVGCSHYLVCSINTKPLCGNGMSRLCMEEKVCFAEGLYTYCTVGLTGLIQHLCARSLFQPKRR